MNKTKIEWCDYTWNPIKGLCPVGCWYCYARRIYKRFHLEERLEFSVTRGDVARMDRLPPSRIFICSTMEIFHPSVGAEWRDKIFYTIGQFPKHTFIVLTKMPERIDRPMPDNVWLGVSVTGPQDEGRLAELKNCHAKVRFASFEPLLDPNGLSNRVMQGLDWAIVGRLTGHGKRHDPDLDDLIWMRDGALLHDVPIFMKNNIASIWGKPLIQEYPD